MVAQNCPGIPHPDLLDMRRAYGTKIRLGLCTFFFCVHNRSPLLRRLPRIHGSQGPFMFPIFSGRVFGMCIGWSYSPAIWDLYF